MRGYSPAIAYHYVRVGKGKVELLSLIIRPSDRPPPALHVIKLIFICLENAYSNHRRFSVVVLPP